VVGRLTAEANRWVVGSLGIVPGDRVLDVGCGPGLGLAIAAAAAPGVFAAGVDPSPVMLRQARRRNRGPVREGRVAVVGGDASALPFPDGHFDKVWSLNSMQFWPVPEVATRELRRVLVPGGGVVVALMARSDDPPPVQPPPWLIEVAGVMGDCGLGKIRFDRRAFGGVTHWALAGARAGVTVTG
jgi:ubiquinone/menaquinone biosynthesis C-methylase UbiE